MTKTKRVKGTLLTLAMLGSLLAGCSGGNGGGEEAVNVTQNNQQQPDEAPEANETQGKASDKPVTATFFYYDGVFQIAGDMPVFKKAAELTNVNLENVAPKAGEAEQAYNLMLASGELPDIIAYKASSLNTVALEGALTPLDDLIAEHAPNLNKFLNDNPDIKKAIAAADGKTYIVPFITDGTAREGWFTRTDWLEKLGLSEPKTVDEYYSMLKAFKEKDPNGNGKQDEIPFFSRNANSGVYGLLPLWDAFQDFYVEEGTVRYGPYEPSYKNGMANIAKWYKEGLIDKEIFTRGNKARDVLFANNTGGAVHDWFASTSNYNVSVKDMVPGFSLRPIAPPASVSGKVQEVTKRDKLNGNGWAISSKTEDPAMIMRYFDFWWSEEGRRLFNFGVEGVTYTMVDGKPKFTEEVLKQPSVVDHLVSTYGAQLGGIGAWQDFAYEEQWSNEIALEGFKLYEDNNYINTEIQLPPLNFSLEEKNRLTEILPPIQTYVAETSQRWVMGGEAVDTGFEKYNAQLKQMGMDEVLQIYQAALERFKQ